MGGVAKNKTVCVTVVKISSVPGVELHQLYRYADEKPHPLSSRLSPPLQELVHNSNVLKHDIINMAMWLHSGRREGEGEGGRGEGGREGGRGEGGGGGREGGGREGGREGGRREGGRGGGREVSSSWS